MSYESTRVSESMEPKLLGALGGKQCEIEVGDYWLVDVGTTTFQAKTPRDDADNAYITTGL